MALSATWSYVEAAANRITFFSCQFSSNALSGANLMSGAKQVITTIFLAAGVCSQLSLSVLAGSSPPPASKNGLHLGSQATGAVYVLPSVLDNGVSCDGGDDRDGLNSLLGSGGHWGIPAGKTCLSSVTLSLSSAALLGYDISSVLRPSASMTSLLDIGGGANKSRVDGLDIGQFTSLATNAVRYHNSVGNNPIFINRNRITGFPNGILDDAAAPGGDALTISDNFFLNDTVAVNFANWGANSSVHGNYILGGSGIRMTKTEGGHQNEGTRIYDNTILGSTPGGSGLTATAGLEISVIGNIFDQNYAHGAILDATLNPVSAIKLTSNWFGTSSSVAANQDGMHMLGNVEYIPMVSNTFVGWTGWGVNSGSGGIQDVPIAFNKFYDNTTGDLRLDNFAGVTLFGNYFGSAVSWAESSEVGGLTAIGNKCVVPAVGITIADNIIGDGTCGPNQIAGPLTINGPLIARITPMTKIANYSVLASDVGKHFDNLGASGEVDFALPAASAGLSYCFSLMTAQGVRVVASGTDKIAIGSLNTVSGGNIATSATFASVCLEAHGAGQWITAATPDKTQWGVN